MCFYFLKRNYGLEPTTMREIFFEKASAQRKDSEVARYERPYSTFELSGNQLPRRLVAIGRRAASARPFIESDNEWYSASRSLGKQKSREKYPRSTT